MKTTNYVISIYIYIYIYINIYIYIERERERERSNSSRLNKSFGNEKNILQHDTAKVHGGQSEVLE